MPKEIFKHLQSVWVSGQRLRISRLDTDAKPSAGRGKKHKPDVHRADGHRDDQRPKGKKKPGGKPARKPGARPRPAK